MKTGRNSPSSVQGGSLGGHTRFVVAVGGQRVEEIDMSKKSLNVVLYNTMVHT